MKILGNVLWIIFGGLFWSLGLYLLGAIMCITIIGIPIGLQLFKMGSFVLLPFGREVADVNTTGFKTFLNILWAIFFGWEIALGFATTGVLLCITIIGIPFGLQYFKLAVFVLLPLGKDFK